MKLSKDEVKKRIDEVITDEDLKISLLEDIEDSMESDEVEKVTKEDYDKIVSERDELKQKYKERFLSGKSAEKTEDVEEKGLEEKNIIDIKEI